MHIKHWTSPELCMGWSPHRINCVLHTNELVRKDQEILLTYNAFLENYNYSYWLNVFYKVKNIFLEY